MFCIPDIVHEHLSQNAVDLVPLTSKDSVAPAGMIQEGHVYYITRDIRKAIADRDVDKLKLSRDQNVSDLKAIVDNVAKHGEKAWTTPTNKSDGVPYKLIASDDGWMWCYMVDRQEETALAGEETTYKCTISVGSYSKAAKWMGLSMGNLNNVPLHTPIAVLTAMVANSIGKFIGRRLERILTSKAAEEAAEEGARVLSKNGIKYAKWLSKGGAWVARVVSGAIIELVLLFIFNYLKMDFGLEISVYNWNRDEEWLVEQFYEDNADVDPAFAQASLPSISNLQPMPDGTSVVTPESATTYAMYTFKNRNTWLEGVGAGLKIVSKSDSSRYAYIKYQVRWGAPDNRFNLGNKNSGTSLYNFYEHAGWDQSGRRTIEVKIPGAGSHSEIPLRGMTPALNGDKDHFYSFEVHIGEIPTSD